MVQYAGTVSAGHCIHPRLKGAMEGWRFGTGIGDLQGGASQQELWSLVEGCSHLLVEEKNWGKRLWSPSPPHFPFLEPDDKGALTDAVYGQFLGHRAGWREVERRSGGEMNLPSTVIFTVSASLEKRNGKESGHLFQTIVWNGVFRNVHPSWCNRCPWVVSCHLFLYFHPMLLTSLSFSFIYNCYCLGNSFQ